MKHVILAILLLLNIFTQGQTTLVTTSDNFEFILDGHVEMFFGTDNPRINPDSLHVGEVGTMLRPMLKLNSDSLIGVFEPNISNVWIDNSNWLLQAAIGYKIDATCSILMGRIMTSSIFLTPAARFNPLVRCPRVPASVYVWGVQLNQKVNDELNIMWDVTTDTTKSFQDEDTFDGLETSLRLTYKFDERWSLAGNLSCDFINHDILTGLDTTYKNGPFDVRLVGYAKSDDHPRDTFGAYAIATYLVAPWLEVHGGLDIQDEHGTSQTVGLRIFFTEDKKLDARFDFIHSEDFGPEGDMFAFGARKRF